MVGRGRRPVSIDVNAFDNQGVGADVGQAAHWLGQEEASMHPAGVVPAEPSIPLARAA